MMGATMASVAIHAGCSSSDETSSSAKPMAGSNVKDIKVGSLGIVRSTVLLGRDAGGLYAMTAVCTHNQCDMTRYGEFSGSGLMCMCHGSQFSLTGENTHGPANTPLKHLKVDVGADGTIAIDEKTVVDAAMRTPVTG